MWRLSNGCCFECMLLRRGRQPEQAVIELEEPGRGKKDDDKKPETRAYDWRLIFSVLLNVLLISAYAATLWQVSAAVEKIKLRLVSETTTVATAPQPQIEQTDWRLLEHMSAVHIPEQTALTDIQQRRLVYRRVREFVHTRQVDSGKSDVTLVTQLSLDRLDRLHGMADTYKGPISAAVYITDVSRDVPQILDLCKSSTSVRKHVDIHLVMQHTVGELYPVNSLRNVAMRCVRTHMMMLLDVDLIPNPTIHTQLLELMPLFLGAKSALSQHRSFTDTQIADENLDIPKHAWVVPAFEIVNDTQTGLPYSKQDLIYLIQSGSGFPVHENKEIAAMHATEYGRWYTSDQPYEIKYEMWFEPYLVVPHDIPLCDELFSGYGNDKVSHTYELAAAGYSFSVLPESFLVHLYHPAPQWRKRSHSPTEQVKIWKNWEMFKQRIRKTYQFFIPDRNNTSSQVASETISKLGVTDDIVLDGVAMPGFASGLDFTDDMANPGGQQDLMSKVMGQPAGTGKGAMESDNAPGGMPSNVRDGMEGDQISESSESENETQLVSSNIAIKMNDPKPIRRKQEGGKKNAGEEGWTKRIAEGQATIEDLKVLRNLQRGVGQISEEQAADLMNESPLAEPPPPTTVTRNEKPPKMSEDYKPTLWRLGDDPSNENENE
eukprot:c16271_g1_i4.p1 GENE.c16271_g1_i4~~c16271_g1_i4.p1  ORF type:complete len:660 (+),score=126.85 c16271_g1_i4:3-1982(+)